MKRRRVQADAPYGHYAEQKHFYRKDVVYHPLRLAIKDFLQISDLVNIVLAYIGGDSSNGDENNEWKRFITSTLGPRIGRFGGSISFCVTDRSAFLKDQTGNQIKPGTGSFFFGNSKRLQITGVLAHVTRDQSLFDRVTSSITSQGLHPGISLYLSDGWTSASYPFVADSEPARDVFFIRRKSDPENWWIPLHDLHWQLTRHQSSDR